MMAQYTNPFDVVDEAQARRKRLNAQNEGLLKRSDLASSTAVKYRDLLEQYGRGMDQQVSGYANRGLGRSGLFKNAMARYAMDQQNAMSGIASDNQSQSNQLQLQDQQSAQELQDFLDRQQVQKSVDISTAARELRNWQPFTGTYS
jgi:hypothetical protein